MYGLKIHNYATRIENVELTRGDTLAFGVRVAFDEAPQELDSAFFTIRTEDGVVVQKSLGDGIWLDSQGAEEIEGKTYECMYYKVRVAPRDTEDLPLGDYNYDFEINLNSDRFTLLSGRLRLTYDSTR